MKRRRPAPKTAALLLWHWLLAGFFLGTLTLMGPVRWTVSHARAAGWSAGAERAAVLAFIAALALVSLLLARLLAARTLSGGAAARYGLPAASLALFLTALAFWLNPRLMIDSDMRLTGEGRGTAQFVFGPYPDRERLAALKKEGYTAVVPLLSRAVVPFEPMLLDQEEAAARDAGLEVVHIPMLPWVSSNENVEPALRALVARGGRYYVHCYLGKDRVNVFRRKLEAVPGADAGGAGERRSLADIKAFERGPVTALETDVFLIPYPTDEELFGYVLNGNVVTLVSLLDPANPENLPWMKKEREIAAGYRVRLVNYPWLALDAAGKKKAVGEIKALKRPVAVHAFLSKTPECEDFAVYYRR